MTLSLITREDFEKIYEYVRRIIDFRREHFPDDKYEIRTVIFGTSKKQILSKGWLGENFWDDKEKAWEFISERMSTGISITQLPNEMTIESDVELDFNELVRVANDFSTFLAEQLKLKHYPIYSGGKSIHFHIYLDEYDVKKLERIKKEIWRLLDQHYGLTKALKLDYQGIHYNHPFRVPYSYHPETQRQAVPVYLAGMNLEWVDDLSLPIIEKLLSEPPIEIREEPKQESALVEIVKQRELEQRIKRLARGRNGQSKIFPKLKVLYDTIKDIEISDGRDRVLLMLITIATFLRLPYEKVEKDIELWASKVNWKPYRYRTMLHYYKEFTQDPEKVLKVRGWMKNWRWSIRQFINASDIEDEKGKQEILKAIYDILGREYVEKYILGLKNGQ